MFLLARRSLFAHKVRLLLTMIAVVLGVGFVSGTYIFTDSIDKAFNNLFEDINEGTALTVRSVKADPDEVAQSLDGIDARDRDALRITETLLPTITETEGVEAAAGVVQGFAQLFDKNKKPIGGQGPPALGFSWSDNDTINSLSVVEGRGPAADGEIVVDITSAELGKLKIGDKIPVVFNGGAQQEKFTVVGLVKFGEENALQGATISAFSLTTAQRVFESPGKFDIIPIVVKPGSSVEKVKKALEERLPKTAEVVTAQETTNESVEAIKPFVDILRYVMLGFAAIALFVGAFVIFNTFSVTVAQRTKEIGLLRCIGASRIQITGMLLGEGLGIGFLSSIVGIGLGFGFAAAITALLKVANIEMPSGDLTLEPRTVIAALIVGIGVTVASAFLPALRASRITPIEALRSGSASTKPMRWWMVAIGLVVTLAGVGLLSAGLAGAAESTQSTLTMLGAGFALMIIGTASLTPLIVRPVTAVLKPVLLLTGGVGTLAHRNVVRNTRRTATTAAALMIGLGLACFASVFTTSAQATVERQVDAAIGSDLFLTNIQRNQAGAGLPPKLAGTIADIPGVKSAVGMRSGPMVVDGNRTYVGALPGDQVADAMTITAQDGDVDKIDEGTMIVSSDTADSRGWKVGTKVKVASPADEKKMCTLTVAGIFESAGLSDTDYLLSTTDYEKILPAQLQLDSIVFVNITADANAAAVRKSIEKEVVDQPAIQVQDTTDLKKEISSNFDQLLGLIYGLLFLSLVIALFGIINTLFLSVYDRTSEIGMLRAVGMTRRQIRSMIRREAVAISMLGAILGLVLGVGFGWAGVLALKDEGFILALPWGTLVLLVVVGVFAGLLSSLLPARSAARMDVLKAISTG